MREPLGSNDTYLVLETSSGLFAISIRDVKGVVIGTQAMRPTVLPDMADHVNCVAMVRGQLTTIVTLPGDKRDVQLLGNPIVILEHPRLTIGVIANNVKLIVIPRNEITTDGLSGTKTYAEGSNIFSILDIEDLFRDKEYGTCT